MKTVSFNLSKKRNQTATNNVSESILPSGRRVSTLSERFSNEQVKMNKNLWNEAIGCKIQIRESLFSYFRVQPTMIKQFRKKDLGIHLNNFN